ncbi:DUF3082 domain-containing protein [Vulcanococcus sp.]|uniref:DUF3082 domain-containing protein n=1 Tax=Vulcanococcus sp. TaxID=2856995 RepID=UPI003C00DEFC
MSETSSQDHPSPLEQSDHKPDQKPDQPVRKRKGPLSFLSGSVTSLGLGWLALQLAQRIVGYYATHPPQYEARFAQSIAVFMKTLVVGMSFLATFTFAFVGLGLFLTFIRSLLPGWEQAEESP